MREKKRFIKGCMVIYTLILLLQVAQATCETRVVLKDSDYTLCLRNMTYCNNTMCLDSAKDYYAFVRMADYEPFNNTDSVVYLGSFFIYGTLFLSVVFITITAIFGSLLKWKN